MKKIYATEEEKGIVDIGSIFTLSPLIPTGVATYFWVDDFWMVALLNAPAALLSLNLFANHARRNVASLYSKIKFGHDIHVDYTSDKNNYTKKEYEKTVEVAKALPKRDIYAAIFRKKPFSLEWEDKHKDDVDRWDYAGGTKIEVVKYEAKYDGKKITMVQSYEPDVFELWQEALANARKLK